MLANWIRNDLSAAKVDTLSQLMNTLQVDEDRVASAEIDALHDSMEMVELSMTQAQTLFTSLATVPKCNAQLAEAIVASTNAVLYPTTVTVSLENLFTLEDDGDYAVSMEGVTFTWKEIYRFVASATRVIADAVMKFFGRRLTLMGQLHTKAVHLERELKDVKLVNMDKLMSMTLVSEGAALDMYPTVRGKSAAGIHEITTVLNELVKTLDPKGYRIHIESYVSLLASAKSTPTDELISALTNIRRELYRELRTYLNASQGKEPGAEVNKLNYSELLPGFRRFRLEMTSMDYKAPMVSLDTDPNYKEKQFRFTPETPHSSEILSSHIAKSLDAAMQLRQDYLAVRKFKERADDAVKTLQDRRLEDGGDLGLVALYRALPSYVRCYTAPLKIKSELVYIYCLGLLDLIRLSYKEWEVKM